MFFQNITAKNSIFIDNYTMCIFNMFNQHVIWIYDALLIPMYTDIQINVTIHHETSVKSPLGNFPILLYLESTCPKL